jgi:hypothetical protein
MLTDSTGTATSSDSTHTACHGQPPKACQGDFITCGSMPHRLTLC